MANVDQQQNSDFDCIQLTLAIRVVFLNIAQNETTHIDTGEKNETNMTNIISKQNGKMTTSNTTTQYTSSNSEYIYARAKYTTYRKFVLNMQYEYFPQLWL